MLDRSASRNGFTVIEVALVIMIVGILTIPLILMYEQYLQAQRIRMTHVRIDQATSEISIFNSQTWRYPCPSDRSLKKGDPRYGYEFNADPAYTDPSDPTDNCSLSALGLSVGQCTTNGGLCLVAGTRDADGNGTIDPVLIGGVPFASLAKQQRKLLESSVSLDGWGSQMTYAVSANLTVSSTVDRSNGVINAIDEHGQKTAGINDNAHYAVISHGPDRKGAFNENGIRAFACASAGTARDRENCDDSNATFVQGIAMTRGNNNNNYYDDQVIFIRTENGKFWDFTIDSAGVESTTDIQNLNSGRVGIGTDAPTQKVDVNGDIIIRKSIPPNPETYNSAYFNGDLLTNTICNRDGTNCMDIASFTAAASAIKCTNSQQAIRAIQANDEICATPVYVQPLPNQDCGTRWIKGFKTNGEVICTD